ncbi:unnamed protein product [Cyprideis torosa]|uniref:Uncharacterized protein n=1 Tax=Cyprideis torosa TaxID=163714 RepID=A0A7R8W4D4_9CRUS|nr:unnamed protein product [Cyprideis torosa]CAG0880525.1 unnamed protein product [Cyprideis torosa]
MTSLPSAVNSKYGNVEHDGEGLVEIFVPLKYCAIRRPTSVLILNNLEINSAGNDEDLEKTCGSVRELDLAENKLVDWHEIFKILNHARWLTFLNLSYNRLDGVLNSRKLPDLPHLNKLVLINTGIKWDTLHSLLNGFRSSKLEELHLGLNSLARVEDHRGDKYPSVASLSFNGNPIQNGRDVLRLGHVFPSLRCLVVADCPICDLGDTKELNGVFPCLEKLNLSNTNLSGWDELEKLKVLDSLIDLRLMGCKALEDMTEHERRQQMIARMENLIRLNGGIITRTEREDAERAFIRQHLDKPETELPDRFHDLVAKHGMLDPLAEIDLSPQTEVTVTIHKGDDRTIRTVSVYKTVLEFKQSLEEWAGLPPNRMRLFYVDQAALFVCH